jgi:hypothetical protein
VEVPDQQTPSKIQQRPDSDVDTGGHKHHKPDRSRRPSMATREDGLSQLGENSSTSAGWSEHLQDLPELSRQNNPSRLD